MIASTPIETLHRAASDAATAYREQLLHAAELRHKLRDLQAELMRREIALVQAAGGLKALGANDPERKLGKEQLLQADADYTALLTLVGKTEDALARASAWAEYHKYTARAEIATLAAIGDSAATLLTHTA